MVESLADIEALILKCNSDRSKSFISEATKCYRAGAYRAAIVSTWIAIVFDLTDKLRELALSGDGEAKVLSDKYERYVEEIERGNLQGVNKALEFEREILSVCKDKLGFFDQQQFIDLTRLKEDRHRCAHPTFQKVGIPFEPSAEQARLHIRNAICFVLSQPPVQGKAAIVGIKNQVSSDYFPEDEGKALLLLNKSGLERPADSLVKNLVDSFVFGFLTSEDTVFQKKQVVIALNVIHDQFPALVEDRLRKQLNKVIHDVAPELMVWAVFLVVKTRGAWALLDQPSKDKVEKFIEIGTNEEVLIGLDDISNIPDLNNAVKKKISKLNQDDLAKVVEFSNIRDFTKSRSIELLSESSSWDRTNSIFNDLIFPLFEALTKDDIERIIGLGESTGADLIGAHALSVFADRIRAQGIFTSPELDDLLTKNGADYLVPQ